MRRILLALFALTSLCAAQNFTTITGSNTQDARGRKLLSGSICFQGTDANGTPINFEAGGGGQVSTRPVCAQVSAGVIGSLQIANPDHTLPAGVVYDVNVFDSSGARIIHYPLVQLSGSTWSFDSYVTPITPPLPPHGGSVSGPLVVNGTFEVTGSTLFDSGLGLISVTGITDSGNMSVSGVSTLASIADTGGLSVSGTANLTTLNVSGASGLGTVTVSSTLGVTGASTLGSVSASSATVSGNETVGGTLGVTGLTTLGTMHAASTAVSGNETVGGTLGVTGASTFAGITATGITDSGTLGVTGASTLGAVTTSGITDTGALEVDSTSLFLGALSIAADATVSSSQTLFAATIRSKAGASCSTCTDLLIQGQQETNNNLPGSKSGGLKLYPGNFPTGSLTSDTGDINISTNPPSAGTTRYGNITIDAGNSGVASHSQLAESGATVSLTSNVSPIFLNSATGCVYFGADTTGPGDCKGTGSPEGAVTAVVGSTFRRTDGAAETAMYRKESGSGNTGWVPFSTSRNMVAAAGRELINAAAKSFSGQTSGSGNVDVYTVPAGKRVQVTIDFYNTSAGSLNVFPELKRSATYYRLGTNVSVGASLRSNTPSPYLFEGASGDIVAFNAAGSGLNWWASVVEFDDTSAQRCPINLALASGDNTLYTVAAGKTASAMNSGWTEFATTVGTIQVSNSSGGSLNYKSNVVLSGGTVGASNQRDASTAIANGVVTGIAAVGKLSAGDFISVNTTSSTATQVAWVCVSEK